MESITTNPFRLSRVIKLRIHTHPFAYTWHGRTCFRVQRRAYVGKLYGTSGCGGCGGYKGALTEGAHETRSRSFTMPHSLGLSSW